MIYRMSAFFSLLLLLILYFPFVSVTHGAEKSSTPPPPPPSQLPQTPNVAELIPKTIHLNNELVKLNKKIAAAPDTSTLKPVFSRINDTVQTYTEQLEQLELQKDYTYKNLLQIKEALQTESKNLTIITTPLVDTITYLGDAQQTWQTAQTNWQQWQKNYASNATVAAIITTFQQARETIQNAQKLITDQLQKLLITQKSAADIHSRIDLLIIDINNLIDQMRSSITELSSPPLFSERYRQSLNEHLWQDWLHHLKDIHWFDLQYFKKQGWILGLQIAIALTVLILILSHKNQLLATPAWQFVATHPYSVAIFCGFPGPTFFMQDAPTAYNLSLLTLISISFIRVVNSLHKSIDFHLLVYLLTIFIFFNTFITVSDLPEAFARLYLVLVSIISLAISFWQTFMACRWKSPLWLRGILILGCGFFLVTLALEIQGISDLSEFLLVSSMSSLLALLIVRLGMHLARIFAEWLVNHKIARLLDRLHYDREKAANRLTLGLDAFLITINMTAYLVIWRISETPQSALSAVFSFGFNIGQQKFTVGLVLAALATLYGAFFISWILQKLLLENILDKHRTDPGTRFSIARLLHYSIMLIGFLVVLAMTGVEMTQIAIIFGALGVGIGFGLQTIVNNFASGLIMLFERPVKVGDSIELNNQWAEIRKIGLRATTVQTFDRSEIVVPNSELISNQVINWTLSNRTMRLNLKVAISRSADVSQSLKILLDCARNNAKIMPSPKPQAYFDNIGDDRLNFILRVWIWDIDEMMPVRSELHQEIIRTFRDANIEIPFPQRDVHIHQIDKEREQNKFDKPAQDFC